MPILFNLTDQQKAALREVIGQFKERPTPKEYDRVARNLQWLTKKSRRPTSFPKAESNWRENAGGNKWPVPTVLLELGCSHSDVPEGFAVYPIFDSANTHAVDYAVVVLWREIWNSWGYQSPETTLWGALCKDIESAMNIKLPTTQ